MWILVVVPGGYQRWILVDPSSRPWWNLMVRYRWIPLVDLIGGSLWILVDPSGGSW